MIVCYQYTSTQGITVFSKPDEKHNGNSFAEDAGWKGIVWFNPICAWKIKSYTTNFKCVMPEDSFFNQEKPLNEFLKNKTMNRWNI